MHQQKNTWTYNLIKLEKRKEKVKMQNGLLFSIIVAKKLAFLFWLMLLTQCQPHSKVILHCPSSAGKGNRGIKTQFFYASAEKLTP